MAAQRIRDLIPEVRLIASLRDPVDRSYSVYQMNLRNKGVNRDIPFVEAIRTDHNLRETYADMLAPLCRAVPARAAQGDPARGSRDGPAARRCARSSRFLGVDPDFVPDLSKIANPGGEPRNKLLHGLLSDPRLRVMSRGLLPRGVVDRLRELRSRNLAKQPLKPEDRRAAIGLFRDDILRTQDLIGRDLAAWLRA